MRMCVCVSAKCSLMCLDVIRVPPSPLSPHSLLPQSAPLSPHSCRPDLLLCPARHPQGPRGLPGTQVGHIFLRRDTTSERDGGTEREVRWEGKNCRSHCSISHFLPTCFFTRHQCFDQEEEQTLCSMEKCKNPPGY